MLEAMNGLLSWKRRATTLTRRRAVTASTRTHIEEGGAHPLGSADALPKERRILEFLLHALNTLEGIRVENPRDERSQRIGSEEEHESQLLISPHLPELVRRARAGKKEFPEPDRHLPLLPEAEREAAQAVSRVDQLVATQWRLQYGDHVPMDDRILAAMRNAPPRHHDFLAIGRRRLYWFTAQGEAGLFDHRYAEMLKERAAEERQRHSGGGGGLCGCWPCCPPGTGDEGRARTHHLTAAGTVARGAQRAHHETRDVGALPVDPTQRCRPR